MRASSPSASCPACAGGQINRHVNVVQIKDCDDARAGIDDLSGPVDQVLNPAAARCNERKIDEDCVDPIRLGLGGLDRELRRVALRFGGAKSCLRR